MDIAAEAQNARESIQAGRQQPANSKMNAEAIQMQMNMM